MASYKTGEGFSFGVRCYFHSDLFAFPFLYSHDDNLALGSSSVMFFLALVLVFLKFAYISFVGFNGSGEETVSLFHGRAYLMSEMPSVRLLYT